MTTLGSIGIGSQVVENGYQLIQEIDVASPVGSVLFNSLDGSTDNAYLIESEITNQEGTNATITFWMNGSTMVGTRQFLLTSAASISAARSSTMNAGAVIAGGTNFFMFKLPFADNTKVTKRVIREEEYRNLGASMQMIQYVYDVTSPVTNIDNIELKSSITSGIGSPSRFRLYKLAK